MILKKEISLLASEKGLEDLYHKTNVHLVGIHCRKVLKE